MARLTIKDSDINKNSYLFANTRTKPFLLHVQDVLDKLGHYEDMEEQGYLHIYPILPGQTFWELNTVHEEPAIYPRIAHSHSHCEYVRKNFNKTCFLTEQEAQAALDKYLATTKENS